MKICKRQFRIVTDRFAGYEVQVRYWYYPLWEQAGFVNTHNSIERAERFIEERKLGFKFKSEEVKRFNCD